jgi:flagellar motor switch protein FliG
MAQEKKLTGLDRAAILFKVLGDNLSVTLFKDLSESELNKIRKHSQSIKSIPFNVKKEVLEEFYFQFVSEKFKEKGEEVHHPFDFLKNISEDQIIYLLSPEPPRVIAIALAQLDVNAQANILKRLDPDIQGEVLIQMGLLDEVPYEGVVSIAADLREKSHMLPSKAEFQKGGGKNIAELLGKMDTRFEKQFLDHLQREDPELAKELKKYHFIFNDILMLPDDILRDVLKSVEVSDLAWALKGQSQEIMDRFFNNVPQKTQIILEDELRLLEGPQPRKKVEAAQRKIVDAARKLEQEGRFSIADFIESDFIE